jgi:sorting nexin-41/42
MEQSWTEPLHEYAQFAEIIKKLLLFRHQKHVQFEMTKTALENKREAMDDLERSEAEAQRLQNALSGSTMGLPNDQQSGTRGASLLSGERNENSFNPGSNPNSVPPPYSTPMRRRTSGGGGGLLSAISYSLQGMMDVDPETARRSNISKTKETISQVCPHPFAETSVLRCVNNFSLKMPCRCLLRT